MIKCDFHTHTVFCDGKNTVGEMADAAYEKGLSALGFSGHGYTPFDSSYCMSKKDTEKYLEQIGEVRAKYSDKMDIFAGLEADLFSEYDRFRFDYVIGSVHYINAGENYIAVDNTPQILKDAAQQFFSGDMLSMCERYYEQVARLENVDIIGHFDLITKFCEQEELFDASSRRYRMSALTALDTLIDKDVVFEVNTGAISRGYRKTPYPAPFILKRISERGGRVILSGDAHDIHGICAHFESAAALLKSLGVKNIVTLTKNGFKESSPD